MPGTRLGWRDMFGSVASRFEFERDSAPIEWESLQGFADFFMDHFGPMVTAKAMLARASTPCARTS